MPRSESDFDADELERIARELGYEDWSAVPRIPKRNVVASLEDTGSVRVADDDETLADQIAAAVEV
jgi:hypothetical protein